MKNKLYEGQKLKDFKELVKLYKTKYKDKDAFIYKKTPTSTDYITVTYKKFADDIENLGASLLKRKLKRVCLIGQNRYEWFVSYLAVTTAGMCIVPLDKSLPENEFQSLIERSEADAIIYDAPYEKAIKEYAKNHPKLTLIAMDKEYKDLITSGEKLDKKAYNDIKIEKDKMYIMLFTSGTTNISKAVMHSQSAFCADMYGLSQMIDINESDTFLSFLPLHHVFESGCTFLFGTSCGIRIALCDGLKYIQKNLVEYECTGFCCVPLMLEIMYKKIIQEIKKQHKTWLVNIMRVLFRHAPINVKRKVFKSIINSLGGKLKTIIAGGAAMDRLTLKGYNDFGFDIHQGYGLTETASVLAGENSFYKKNGSVGFELPTMEVKVFEPDKDGIGELIAKTPSIMLGYYKNEDATKEAFDKDGWYHTGDLGYIDKKGFIFLTGRKKDMIVLKNGKKIFPEELESLINKLPYVTESMVFGHVDTTRQDRNEDVILYAEVVYDKEKIKDHLKDVDGTTFDEKCFNLIQDKVKNDINKQMPAYKYIRKVIVTDEPLVKTTTLKTKRNVEFAKIQNKIK